MKNKPTAFELVLEVNSRAIKDPSRALSGSGIMITPPIDEAFWLFRVAVSDKQAIVSFPKFCVFGVGFQHETDWNTNLPSGCDAQEIFNHIKHNKGDSKIPAKRCLDAIRMIQQKILEIHIGEAIYTASKCTTDSERLAAICKYLRKTGGHKIAEAVGQ